MLSQLYGRLAAMRRAWYEQEPTRRRTLERPVVSVGNLVVGGSGKTPLVATLARLLVAIGERPSVLSRGYGRRRGEHVVVVSDGRQVLASTELSGDEPQMLARTLSGVPVLVSADRHRAGRLAETTFGCTVHLLDDGFQHLRLARDVDLLVVSREDLAARVLPFGRLREDLRAARAADAVLVGGPDEDATMVGRILGVATVFRLQARHGRLRGCAEDPTTGADPFSRVAAGARVVAVAGIARPERFYRSLRGQGFDVVRELTYRDHHWFSPRDLETIARAADRTGVDLVVTTEKDAVRLDASAFARLTPARLAWLPLEVDVVESDRFAEWLSERLRAAKVRRGLAA